MHLQWRYWRCQPVFQFRATFSERVVHGALALLQFVVVVAAHTCINRVCFSSVCDVFIMNANVNCAFRLVELALRQQSVFAGERAITYFNAQSVIHFIVYFQVVQILLM